MKGTIKLCILTSAALFAMVTAGQAEGASKTTSSVASKGQADVTAIDSQVALIGTYLAAGDADSLSALWSPEGSYTDSNADVYQGRDNLKKRFQTLLAKDGKPSVTLKPDRTRLLSNTIAVQEGTVLRKYDADKQQTPDTRYSFVFKKEGGKWLIASGSETSIPAKVSEVPPLTLKDLEGLIGSWHAERNGRALKLNVEWAGNKNFVRFNYQITHAGDPTEENTEIVYEDPNSDDLLSWSFDSNGAVGQSVWTKDDKQWQIDSSKVSKDGTTATARNLISVDGKDRFTWQSLNRTADGLPLSDTDQLPIERVSR